MQEQKNVDLQTRTKLARIQREYVDLQKNAIAGVSAGPVHDDDITYWQAFIEGPADCPYEGGSFLIDIRFPETYPFRPPQLKFVTKIWHCNISHKTGAICLDILKDQWSPALTIGKVLLSLLSLLTDPNENDPLAADVANMYVQDRVKHDMVARQWTAIHAME